jgi:hypothetical protein
MEGECRMRTKVAMKRRRFLRHMILSQEVIENVLEVCKFEKIP